MTSSAKTQIQKKNQRVRIESRGETEKGVESGGETKRGMSSEGERKSGEKVRV
jgi:hypothetical protein